ncbi:MAG: nicotinate-nicotinamide nucleotide adenylyltransferase, partial [Youngiibacter sp.]|nr:nicotinate-nicotinamide nucleotide adenylyltransferase [Youngiibacter sp.]
KITVSDYEIRKEDVSYTYLTMEHLKEEYPLDELFFIIGEDSFIEFSKWREPGRILAAAKLTVFERRFYPHEMRQDALDFIRSLGHEPVVLDSLILEISSSDVRRRVSEGRSIRFMVPDKVERYILDNSLYGGRNVDRIGD